MYVEKYGKYILKFKGLMVKTGDQATNKHFW